MVLIMVVEPEGENANTRSCMFHYLRGIGSRVAVFQLVINVVSGVMIIAMGDVNLLPVCVALFMFGLWFVCSDFFFGAPPTKKQDNGTFQEPRVPPMAAHPEEEENIICVVRVPPMAAHPDEEENLKCVVMSKSMFWMVNFYVIAYPIVAVLYCRLPDVRADMHGRNHKIKIMEFLLSLFWSVAFSHLLYKCIVERMKDAQGQGYQPIIDISRQSSRPTGRVAWGRAACTAESLLDGPGAEPVAAPGQPLQWAPDETVCVPVRLAAARGPRPLEWGAWAAVEAWPPAAAPPNAEVSSLSMAVLSNPVQTTWGTASPLLEIEQAAERFRPPAAAPSNAEVSSPSMAVLSNPVQATCWWDRFSVVGD
ncbi:unnamed protein product [Prorocentrum cordatum]|uniref:Protein S-acyltransferase n=1 Tax=Prorocentrum cordatum TaxID=2364126 RepID=A0ABN9TG27_9DINO|nr:unnamed protein product [Polarella glacialis]